MSISPKLRAYLERHCATPFKAREWDCSKFAVLWIAEFNPEAAKLAARMIVEAGYNKVKPGDDDGLAKVYAALGARTPKEMVHKLHRAYPDHVELPLRPEPGDIAVRKEGLSFGVIDEDYRALFLAKPHGYQRMDLRKTDAFLRVKK